MRVYVTMNNVDALTGGGKGAVAVRDIQLFRDNFVQLARGLDAAIIQFKEYRNSLVNDTGLQGVPETIVLLKIVSEHYLGDPYAIRDDAYMKQFPRGTDWMGGGYDSHPDPFDTIHADIAKIRGSIEDDLQNANEGKWPAHLVPPQLQQLPSTVAPRRGRGGDGSVR
jgi:hypothetical protein